MATVAGLFKAFSTVTKEFFEINTISIDNWVFKLFYKWSTSFLIIASISITSKQFFGEPIECDGGNSRVDKDVLEAYCWMYSTFQFPIEYQGQCTSGDSDPDTISLVYNSYYQWVPLYLMGTSIMFYIPRVIWVSLEGGLMKFFGKGTRSRIIEDEDEKQKSMIDYYQHHVKNRYNVYFFGFIVCELMNLLAVAIFFLLTDRFLNFRFLDYGWKVMDYFRLPPEEQMVPWIKNPMCRTFPRIASCNYFRYGIGGGQENINAICILTLNVINDKIFYILWWWFAALSVVSFYTALLRLLQCSSATVRYQLINVRLYRFFQISSKADRIEKFIRQSKLGDWFILYQLSKNLHRPFFMDFVTDLSYQKEDDEGSDAGDNVLSMMLRPAYVSQESEAVH